MLNVNAQITSAPNCFQAKVKQQDEECTIQQQAIDNMETQYWVTFTATNPLLSLMMEQTNVSAPSFGKIILLSGDCTSNVKLDSIINPAYNQEYLFEEELVLGQNYFLCFEDFTPSEIKRIFGLCLFTPKCENFHQIGYIDPCLGDTVQTCDDDAFNVGNGSFEVCTELYVCPNQELVFDVITCLPPFSGYESMLFNEDYNFISPQGQWAEFLTFQSAVPGAYEIENIRTIDYPINSDFFDNTFYNSAYSMTINVIDPNSSNYINEITLCENEEYTHDFLNIIGCSDIYGLSIDGISVDENDPSLLTNVIFSLGTHTIIETIETDCGLIDAITTVIVEEIGFEFNITDCGLATFTYSECEEGTFANIGIDFGDGNSLPTQLVELPFTYEYQYSNLTDVSYIFTIPNGNPNAGPIFEETGLVTAQTINDINLILPTLGCEGAVVTIDEPGINFTNIEWSIGGVTENITGQGTITMSPDWTLFPVNADGDPEITVNATDENGCLYEATAEISKCCNTVPVQGKQLYGDLKRDVFGGPVDDFPNQSAINANTLVEYNPANFSTNYSSPVINTAYTGSSNMSDILTQLNIFPSYFVGGVAYYNFSSQQYIYFNNDIVIDVNILFSNANIKLAPGVTVTVIGENTLELNKTTLAQRCDEMWGGIIVEGSDASLKTNSGTWIFNAETAVTSNNGGRLILNQTKFIDNNVGVRFNDFSENQQGVSVVKGNLFSETHIVNESYPLLKPYSIAERPEYAIMIFNNQNVKIGNDQTFTDRNHIERHRNGIFAANSNVKVIGNLFTDISGINDYADTLVVSEHKAIAIYGNPITNRVANVRKNYFNGCDVSVELNRDISGVIRDNYIKYSKKRAITYQYNGKKSVTITNNNISSAIKDSWGIFCYQNSIGTYINIKGNKINTGVIQHLDTLGQSINGNKIIGGGILVDNFVFNQIPTTPNVYVTNNTIRKPIHGIIARSVNNIQVNKNLIYQHHSQNFLQTSGYQFNGIWLQNVHSSSIVQNRVFSNIPFNSVKNYDHKTMRGITNENSFNNFIFKNTTQKIPAGLVAFGANGNTQFNCNRLFANTNGIYTINADMANQGVAPGASPVYGLNGQSAANRWQNNVGLDRTDGSMLNEMDYFRHNLNSQNSSPAFSIQGEWLDFELVNSVYSSCKLSIPGIDKPGVASPLIHGPKLARENAFGEIVNGTTSYTNPDYTQALDRWKSNVALITLSSDSSYFVGDSSDAVYFDFIAACNGSTTEKICKTQERIEENEMVLAETENESYSPACIQDEYNQKVQRLFINQSNGQELTAIEVEYLEMVACLDPILNGSGVYQARTMLGWAGNCANNLTFKSLESTIDEDAVNAEIKIMDVKLYPNPNNGMFTISYVLESEATLTITDITGKIIKTEPLISTKNNVTLELNETAGIYLYTVIDKAGNRKTGKFVIQ